MLAGISLTILSCISFGALAGAPPHVFATFRPAEQSLPTRVEVTLRRIVPQVLTFIGHSPFANLAETEVSTRRSSPSDHNDISPTIIQGAALRQRNLRYANAVGAFLVNADLRGADLVGADLRRADLRGARLDGANLLGSNLRGADLRNVTGLTGAQIQGAITDATTRLPIVALDPSDVHP